MVWEQVQLRYAELLSKWRTDLGGKKNFHNGVGGINMGEWIKVIYGLVMSLLLGFVILSILVGMRQSLPTTVVGGFHEGAQSNARLQAGDRILRVNGSRVFTSNDISFSMVSDKDGVVTFTVLRGGEKLELRDIDFGMQVMEDGAKVINLDFYVDSVPKTFWSSVQYTILWLSLIHI